MTAPRTNWRARAERAEAALRTLLTLAGFPRGGVLSMDDVARHCLRGLGMAENKGGKRKGA